MQIKLPTHFIFPLAIFLFTFTIYLHNLSASVYGGDSGDFLTAIITKGIPHPSGYPLYTLLGILTSALPIPKNIVWKINILSALFSSLSVVVMYLLVKEITKNKLVSLLASLSVAFIYPFWIYAEVTEIFALHSFFILLLTYVFFRYIRTKSTITLSLLFFLFGLSLTNNEVILLVIFPISLFLLIIKNRQLISKRMLLKLFLSFALGLIPYLYIPITAFHHPQINWENINSFAGFFNLIFRKDYGWKLTANFDPSYLTFSLKIYMSYILLYLNWIFLVLAVFGFGYLLYRKNYFAAFFLFIIFFFLGPFFILFSRFPLQNFSDLALMQRFYIGSLLVLIIFMSIGIFGLSELISAPMSRDYKNFLIGVFLLIPLIFFFKQFIKTDLSTNTLGNTFAQDLLSPLPKTSVVFFTTDTPVFNALYLQYGNHFRTDIQIPGENRIETLAFGKKFTHDQLASLLHTATLQQQELAYISDSVRHNRPIFTDTTLTYNQKKYGHLTFMPYGLLFKIATKDDVSLSEDQYIEEQTKILQMLHLSSFEKNLMVLGNDLMFNDMKQKYLQAYIHTGDYLATNYHDVQKAKLFYIEARLLE